MATIKDVAQRAGVSLTTASIVANGRGEEKHISSATIERVSAIIEALGYHPNQNAQQLRAKNARQPVIAFYWPLDYRANMLGIRLVNLHSVLLEQELNYEIVVQTYFNDQLERFLPPLQDGRYTGAIIAGASDQDMVQLESTKITVPVILINLESRKYSTVGVSHAQMGAQAAALLHKKGYQECAVVKSMERYGGTARRTKAFLYSCKQLGITVRPEWTFSAPATILGGVQATEEFCALTERPGVIFYETDCMAQGGLYTLQRRRIAVPGDIELLSIGVQEPETMQYLTPSISCVTVPPNVDKQAMSIMIRILQEHPEEPLHLELEPLIQLRESFTLPSPL